MNITSIEMGIVRVPLITPFKTALRTVSGVEDVVVRLTAADGTIGLGEAPPTKAITGETLESIQEVIRRRIVPALRRLPEDADLPERLSCVASCCEGSTSAKAAVDIALHDLAARQAGLPLYQFLRRQYGPAEPEGQNGARRPLMEDTGAAEPAQKPAGEGGAGDSGAAAQASSFGCVLHTDLTISVNPIPEMVRDARTAVRRGFRAVKIKVGKEGEQDLLRIQAIREAVGEDIAILVDANQGWTAQDAVHILQTAESMGLNLALVEQPVPAGDLEGMALVTRGTTVPVVADESAFHPEDAERIFAQGAADMVNIKLMKCGGLRDAARIAAIARGAGRHCMMGCMLESSISVSAAAHFAAAQGPLMKAIDLDGPMLCSEDPYLGGPAFDGPTIALNETPGIGITGIRAPYLDGWSTL